MDDAQKAWGAQFSSNFGTREYLRFAVVLVIWLLVGISLTVITHSAVVFYCFLLLTVAFPVLARGWKPAYSLFRLIVGNSRLPSEPLPPQEMRPARQTRPWEAYVSGVWFAILTLTVVYFAVKHYLR